MSARAQLTGQVGEHSRKSVPYTEALRDVLEEVRAVLDHACSLIETEGKQSLEYWAAVSALGGLNQHFNFLVQEEGPDTQLCLNG
jgi:hypothetical protein